jgi:hypothetical protein
MLKEGGVLYLYSCVADVPSDIKGVVIITNNLYTYFY